jgi:formiminotetrahydrofolate cyclodeaminase
MSIATDAEIEAFLKVLDPEDNATGGGTASAVAGAMAAGLAGMVARVSRGKPDLEPEQFYDDIDQAARRLTRALLDGGREDSEAFGHVMSAYRLPKSSEEEKAARSAAIQRGLEGATTVPLENGERCAEALVLVNRLTPKHNTNASSDLDVGRRLAIAALEGCIDNVEINMGSLKNEDVSESFAVRLNELRSAVASATSGETDV